MTLASILLVVLASFIHASWNLLAKRAAPAGPYLVFAYTLIAAMVYAPWVGYLLLTGGVSWTWAGAGFVLLSAVIHLGYSLFLQRGYQVADLSVVYSVARGTGPMLSSLAAFLLLGESPTAAGLLGLVLVVAGILMIATQGRLATFSTPGISNPRDAKSEATITCARPAQKSSMADCRSLFEELPWTPTAATP